MAPEESFSYEVTTKDADILWIYDLRVDLGMCPHDTPSASILIDGDFLYLNTCNGVDRTHKVIRAPDAPSLIVIDKKTGRLVGVAVNAVEFEVRLPAGDAGLLACLTDESGKRGGACLTCVE